MRPPSTIAHYKITAKLGEGGMGEVWRATDTKLNRDVAVKVLTDAFARDADGMARFAREAQVLAALNHPNIAQIHGVEECALIMEFVDGETLAGPLPVDAALAIARQIAEALEYAHEKGIIHRDLKPANIKVTAEGRVKVLDFGLAKALSVDRLAEASPTSSPTLTMRATQMGTILGTAAYMAPEQARGVAVDKRADIWSFGVVLYEMLTGRRLFDGDTVTDTLAAVLKTDPDWSALPSATPAAVHRLLRRCLERDRKRRLSDMADARLEIDEALVESPAAPASVMHRRPVLLWSVAALMVTLIVTAATLWRTSRPMERPLMRFDVDLGPDAIAGTNIPAAISGDGRRLVYLVRGPDGKPQLATRLLDESKATLLAGTENASDPFFSPDGRWIGFFAGGMMKKMPIQGGAVIPLCDAAFSRGASWGPDGNIIATINTTGGMVRVPDTGGTPKPLSIANKTGEIAHRWPQVLPGGQAVLFSAAITPANYEDALINVVSLKTGQQKTVIRGGYFGRYLPGGSLLYIHQGTLYAVPFDAARLELRGSPAPVLDDVAGNTTSGAGQFDFSQTGTFLFASGHTAASQYSVAWLDAAGTIEPILSAPGTYLTPRLSPDGKWLALSGVPAAPNDLWLYDWQRGVLTRLTFTGHAHRYPVWTPDGKYIVFSAQSAGGGSMWWMRADRAGQAKLLMESKDVLWPASFSPDGRRLAFVQRTLETGFDIWTLPLDTSDPDQPKPGQPEPFLRTAADELAPAFSPDGRWMAYESSEAGATQVYVRPFPGPGGIWQISTGSGTLPVWSPNGRELFYESRDNRIMAADYTARRESFDAGRPRPWCSRQIWNTVFSPNLDLAPDGKRFVAFPGPGPNIRAPQVGPVHVTFLLNFFDEVGRRVPSGAK
jgi:serine/threonine-protein kinase